MNFSPIAKRVAFIFLLHSSCISLSAQTDSLPRHHFSVNLAAGMISGEAGLYYDYRISKFIGLQFSYGHRFYSFNMVQTGGFGYQYKYAPQQGDIARIGLKLYFMRDADIKTPRAYSMIRLGFWKLHTPTHISRYGLDELDYNEREIVSVDKSVFNLGTGLGKEFHFKSHLYMDLFFCIGISVGEKKINKYYYEHMEPYEQIKYPDNTYKKKTALFPTIELGFRIGLYR